MDRRAFTGSLAGGLLAAPLDAQAQTGRMPKVGILDPSTEEADTTLKAYALRTECASWAGSTARLSN